MTLPQWAQWFVVLAPLLPALLHAAGFDNTAVGRIITSILPDIIGAFKKQAPPEAKP